MKLASFFRITRLTKHGLLLVAFSGWMLSPSSVAQDQSGRNLIFGREGRVGTGGPTSDQAKKVLQQRIQEQSEGQATLFGFRHITTRPLDLEISGKQAYAVEFEAGVEFAAPCQWASRYQGRPLTFVLLKLESSLRNPDPRNLIEVKERGGRYVMQGYALFTPASDGWVVAGFGQTTRPVLQSVVPDETSAACVAQLKQIGLAFRMWAADHNDKFPFNTSTGAGGTQELCSRGGDGFDASASVHFQVMSNELNSPKILVCPADTAKHPATDFRQLQAVNVSYLVRSGAKIDETNPEEILVRCPVHGHVGLCDGSVKQASGKRD
ncbi:MAG: hypothetical protein M9920_09400 [Verrucomicrobiae bacterium]|nr:hypothetical protein [Verrucomicrobiae bacterium]